MAGHSKWANIKFRKSAQDAKRGKIFTRLIREISVSARMGGGEEDSNPRLRDAITRALRANMKRDTIDNAVKRGAGGLDYAALTAMRYEGYGPGGVAVLVDCLSDNKNRTVSEVRHAFTKYGGNLGTEGSVAFVFKEQGEILLAPSDQNDKAMDIAIEAGAEDVTVEENQLEVITSVETFHAVQMALQKAGFTIEESRLTMRPQSGAPLDSETAETVIKLIDALEDLDDVQNVYSNAEFPDSVLKAMEA